MKRALLIAGLVFAVIAAFRIFPKDERTAIQEALKQAAKDASFEGPLKPFDRLVWAKNLSGYAAEDCSFVLLTRDGEKEVLAGRSALREQLVVFRSALDQFALALLSPRITLDGAGATVVLTARGIGREPGRPDYFKEEHEIRIQLQKVHGRWLVARAQTTQPYEGEWHAAADQ